jgi:patatin-like phospholipase/acyl hydrolase
MKILSIGGGGIRGIIPGQVLVALEEKIQKRDPNKRIADVFDMVAGTSTGGILTCLYLCPDATGKKPRFSAEDAVNLYLQNGDNIFDVSLFRAITTVEGFAGPKYSAEALETILKNYLGDLKLSQFLKPCLITSYDITRREAKFFNQADFAEEGATRDFLARDVARATSAAPTYFAPANIQALDLQVYPLVDGGVFANNPTMCACVEAFGYDPKLEVSDLQILSLGTGDSEHAYHYAEAKKWGKLQWLEPILDILMSGVSETVDYQMKTLFESAKCSKQYLRIQPELAKFPEVDPAMDNASEKNMQALEAVGDAMATKFNAELDAFVDYLLPPKK